MSTKFFLVGINPCGLKRRIILLAHLSLLLTGELIVRVGSLVVVLDVCLSVNIFKHRLLGDHWADWSQISCESLHLCVCVCVWGGGGGGGTMKICSNGPGHMTKMAATRTIYGKNPSEMFFSWIFWPIVFVFGSGDSGPIIICSNDDTGLTMTDFMPRSVWSLMLLFGEKVKIVNSSCCMQSAECTIYQRTPDIAISLSSRISVLSHTWSVFYPFSLSVDKFAFKIWLNMIVDILMYLYNHIIGFRKFFGVCRIKKMSRLITGFLHVSREYSWFYRKLQCLWFKYCLADLLSSQNYPPEK